jgi:hypothetical protein
MEDALAEGPRLPSAGAFYVCDGCEGRLASEPAEHKADDQEPYEESDEGEATAIQEHFPRREPIAARKADQLARPSHQLVHAAPSMLLGAQRLRASR